MEATMELLLANHVVWEKVAEYLSVTDIECLMSTAKLFRPLLEKPLRQRKMYMRKLPRDCLETSFSCTPRRDMGFHDNKMLSKRIQLLPLQVGYTALFFMCDGTDSHPSADLEVYVGIFKEEKDEIVDSRRERCEEGKPMQQRKPNFAGPILETKVSYPKFHHPKLRERFGADVLSVGNILLFGKYSYKITYPEPLSPRISPKHEVIYFEEADRGQAINAAQIMRYKNGFLYAVNRQASLTIYRIVGETDDSMDVSQCFEPFHRIKVRPGVEDLNPGMGGGHLKSLKNHLYCWTITCEKKLQFSQMLHADAVKAIKLFTFNYSTVSKNYHADAKVLFLDCYAPVKNMVHSEEMVCDSWKPTELDLYCEWEPTKDNKIICLIEDRRSVGTLRILVIDSSSKMLISNVVLDGDLGSGFSAYTMYKIHAILKDGCLIACFELRPETECFGKSAHVMFYRATDQTANAMSIKASGCSQYGVSKLNSMLEYDSNLGHIFYLTDGELDEDKRAGLQTRNRLLGEIGKCIVRVYETRGSEINQLPCGDVNKYYLRNTSEYPARFAQDRQGRWYVLNCAFDLLEKVNEKHFEINGYCLTNKLEKK